MRGRRIAESDALEHVRGYRCANDLSARNIQYTEAQWTRAKGFDTFCPLGTELVPVSELGDGSGLRVVQRLNGEVLQDGNTTRPALLRCRSSSRTSRTRSRSSRAT